MSIYEQLEKEYALKKELMNKGETVDKLDLMFKGYALDAVDTAKRNFKIELDFSEDSIEKVEKILDVLNKTMKRDNPPKDLVLSFAKQFSGYMGQVMLIKWSGEWKDENEYSIKNGPGLRVKGQDLFLLSKVYRRITNGADDNVWHFYQVIKSEIDGTKNINEVQIEELRVKEKKSWIKRILGR